MKKFLSLILSLMILMGMAVPTASLVSAAAPAQSSTTLFNILSPDGVWGTYNDVSFARSGITGLTSNSTNPELFSNQAYWISGGPAEDTAVTSGIRFKVNATATNAIGFTYGTGSGTPLDANRDWANTAKIEGWFSFAKTFDVSAVKDFRIGVSVFGKDWTSVVLSVPFSEFITMGSGTQMADTWQYFSIPLSRFTQSDAVGIHYKSGAQEDFDWSSDYWSNFNSIVFIAETENAAVAQLGWFADLKLSTSVDTPSSLICTDTNAGSTVLSWSAVSNATGYLLKRSVYDSATDSYINETTLVDTSLTTYTDLTTESGNIYWYSVEAYNAEAISEAVTLRLPLVSVGLPTVSLTAPADNTVIDAGASLTVTAEASANGSGNSITSVEFYQNNNLLTTVTEAPYTYTWENVPQGNYSLIAKANDSFGNSAESAPVSVQVTPVGTDPIIQQLINPAATQQSELLIDGVIKDGVSGAGTNGKPFTYNPVWRGAGHYNMPNDEISGVSVQRSPDPAENQGAWASVYALTDGNTIDTARDWQSTANLEAWLSLGGGTDLDWEIALTYRGKDGKLLLQTLDAATLQADGYMNFDAAYAVGKEASLNTPCVWQKVKIPVSYFAEKGTFSDYDSTGTTAFPYEQINGVAFFVTTNTASEHILRIADLKFTANCVEKVTNLTGTMDETSGTTLSWDAVTGAAGYKIYRDNVLLEASCTLTTYTDAQTKTGTHTYIVQAYDAATVSEPVSIQLPVAVIALPTVSITAPENGFSMTENKDLTITAEAAADGEGNSITSVEFYQNDTLLATVTESPYTYTWEKVPAGTYTLTAKAYDAVGGSKVSEAVQLTVTEAITTPVIQQLINPAATQTSELLSSGVSLAGVYNAGKEGRPYNYGQVWRGAGHFNMPSDDITGVAVQRSPDSDEQLGGWINVFALTDGNTIDTARDWQKTAAVEGWLSLGSGTDLDWEISLVYRGKDGKLLMQTLTAATLQADGYMNFGESYVVDNNANATTKPCVWQKISIPVSYFAQKGTFNDYDASGTEAFPYEQINGVAFSVTTNTKSQNILRIGDLKFVPIEAFTPETNDSVVYLSGADPITDGKLPASGSVKAVVKTELAQDDSAILIIALYRGNELIQIATSEQESTAGEHVLTTNAITIPTEGSGYTVKAFVWSTLSSLKPRLNQTFILN